MYQPPQQLYPNPQWQRPPMQYPQQPYYPQLYPPNWLEMERQRAAAAKSYTNKAMFTLLLYLVLFVPGLIANIIYLAEANETKKLTNTDPDGWGCLVTMLVVALAPVALVALVVMLSMGAVGFR